MVKRKAVQCTCCIIHCKRGNLIIVSINVRRTYCRVSREVVFIDPEESSLIIEGIVVAVIVNARTQRVDAYHALVNKHVPKVIIIAVNPEIIVACSSLVEVKEGLKFAGCFKNRNLYGVSVQCVIVFISRRNRNGCRTNAHKCQFAESIDNDNFFVGRYPCFNLVGRSERFRHNVELERPSGKTYSRLTVGYRNAFNGDDLRFRFIVGNGENNRLLYTGLC